MKFLLVLFGIFWVVNVHACAVLRCGRALWFHTVSGMGSLPRDLNQPRQVKIENHDLEEAKLRKKTVSDQSSGFH